MDTLTRMRTFVEVVDAGGFSAAARKMGRSKALISKYVRELEDELGARLLNRTTRTLSLTEVGQSYARDATEILQRIEDLQSSIGDAHAAPRGRLKVSAPRTFGSLPSAASRRCRSCDRFATARSSSGGINPFS